MSVTFNDIYRAASEKGPTNARLLDNSEEALCALAIAIKPTGKASGPFGAMAMAGMILGRLRENGWDVVRSSDGQ